MTWTGRKPDWQNGNNNNYNSNTEKKRKQNKKKQNDQSKNVAPSLNDCCGDGGGLCKKPQHDNWYNVLWFSSKWWPIIIKLNSIFFILVNLNRFQFVHKYNVKWFIWWGINYLAYKTFYYRSALNMKMNIFSLCELILITNSKTTSFLQVSYSTEF